MNFRQTEKYLLALGNEVSAMKLGLENISSLLAGLGNPQFKYLKIQVAGTNGKGSTCAFIDAICRSAGIKTGLYTSPHLIAITERIKIAGRDIATHEFARYATAVRAASEDLLLSGVLEYRPTFFEQMTATALLAFADAGIELAILETGLGGRLDATTAAGAEIAAITRIDLDHQNYLGETLAEIASEKAAIIRENTAAVIIGRQPDEAMRVIRDRCEIFGLAPVVAASPLDWKVEADRIDTAIRLKTPDGIHDNLRLALSGRHQIENAQTAVSIAQILRSRFARDITENDVVNGLQTAVHRGRLEHFGRYLLDGAHNIGGARALAAFLDEYESRPVTLVFGAMRDKDLRPVAELLFARAENIILTKPENSRAMPAKDLARFAEKKKVYLTENVGQALAAAEKAAGETGVIVVSGSLYLVGEALGLIAKKQTEK